MKKTRRRTTMKKTSFITLASKMTMKECQIWAAGAGMSQHHPQFDTLID
jgi:hypothetical protein